jgi:hypothetical protein
MKYFKISFALLILINFVSVQSLSANTPQDHVVSLQEIQKQVETKSSQRANNIRDIQKLLRHSEVQKHVGGLIDLQKIKVAVASLDNETLEDLASQSRFANDQLQAGIGTTGLIAIIIVCVVVVILAIVIPDMVSG